jgi:hypothetical protein
MDDMLKHADTHDEEIRKLVDDVMQEHLAAATTANEFCPKCVALTLMEWAAYAAAMSGATPSEVLSAAASGAGAAEDEMEMSDAVPPTSSRH